MPTIPSRVIRWDGAYLATTFPSLGGAGRSATPDPATADDEAGGPPGADNLSDEAGRQLTPSHQPGRSRDSDVAAF